MGGLTTFIRFKISKKQTKINTNGHFSQLYIKTIKITVKSKIVYLAHPIGGNVEQNLASLRNIVKSINLSPKYAAVVPFVPYYADVVSMNDDVPEQRRRGLNNGQQILARKGIVDEMWLVGPTITPGMKEEAFVAFRNGIPVKAFNKLFAQLEQLKKEWENQQ